MKKAKTQLLPSELWEEVSPPRSWLEQIDMMTGFWLPQLYNKSCCFKPLHVIYLYVRTQSKETTKMAHSTRWKVFIIDKRKRMSRSLWKSPETREKETNWTRPVLSRSERAGSELGVGESRWVIGEQVPGMGSLWAGAGLGVWGMEEPVC